MTVRQPGRDRIGDRRSIHAVVRARRQARGRLLARQAALGPGVATRTLSEFLRPVTERPLHAVVAVDDPASLPVLEKCGFTITQSETRFDERLREEVALLLLELR